MNKLDRPHKPKECYNIEMNKFNCNWREADKINKT